MPAITNWCHGVFWMKYFETGKATRLRIVDQWKGKQGPKIAMDIRLELLALCNGVAWGFVFIIWSRILHNMPTMVAEKVWSLCGSVCMPG